MYESDFNESEWLDDELRLVPTPEGLLRRLKLIGDVEDAQIDSVVRLAVTVPEDLLQRLKSIPEDEAIDRRLCEVEVPSSLAQSLHAIAASGAGTLTSGGNTPRPVASWAAPLRRHPAASLAVAVGLLIAVGASVWFGRGLLGGSAPAVENPIASSNPSEANPSLDSANSILAKLHSEARSALEENGSESSSERTTDRTPPSGIASRKIAPSAVAAHSRVGPESPSNKTPNRIDDRAARIAKNPAFKQRSRSEDDNPFGFLMQNQAAGSGQPVSLEKIVGFGGVSRVPDIESVRVLVPRGLAPPRVKEFDQLRYLREGVHPFVSPQASRELEQIRVPISLTTSSYDLLRSRLAQGRIPSADEIRPEDFLAAVDYEFPRPFFQSTSKPHPQLGFGKVGLLTVGGPSPFRGEHLKLLQIGVQTNDPAKRELPPSELVIAIDVTPGIAGQRRLERVRRALAQLPHWFDPGDRVTLVPLTTMAQTLVARAGKRTPAAWDKAIRRLQTETSSDLAEGIAHTAALISQNDSYAWRRNVVLVLGELEDYSQEELQTLQLAIRTASGKATRWDIVRMASTTSRVDAATKDKSNIPYERLAQTGRGQFYSAPKSQELLSALTKILTGNSRLVAKQMRLSVRWNPAVVAKYRLIGHEASQSTLESPGKLEVELFTGQSATALFELQFKPTGGNDVGQAELWWKDPESGQDQHLIQKISRVQFATSKYESALSLQMAAIVSEAAEILRGSPFANSHRRALEEVLAESEKTSPRLRSNRSFGDFLSVIRQAHLYRLGSGN